ncbi:MAG: M23 family metallopeptidase [Xanthomonadaceae bacterium]|nr:M23 family metallopeptidase [Xanthomonadaceae bacterium]
MSGTLAKLALAGCLTVFACASAAQAAKVFRWFDRDGVAHYGDHVPESVDPATTPVDRIPVPAEPMPIARLKLEQADGSVRAWAENNLAGPIEVRLYQPEDRARIVPVRADPPLPVRAVVPSQQRALVATVSADRNALLKMDVVPGDPNARPRDVEYGYPLRSDEVRVEQGYGGRYSHNDAQNRYAVDFAADIGTQVLAARPGTVMQVEADFDRSGLNAEKYAGRANFVRIVHDDGTMALYAHLDVDGVLVRIGQRVRKGQVIGLSGNTGYTTGPHLHFSVQVNRGMKLESIPFRMFGPGGILRFTEPTPVPASPSP